MSDKKRFNKWKSLGKVLLVVGLVSALFLSNANDALAARSGGRIGGGSFRAPTRSAPSRSYRAPSGGGYRSPGGYGGGGFGFPFIIPFFGFGGGAGGLFSILIFIAIANFLVKSFQGSGMNSGGYQSYGGYNNGGYSNSATSYNPSKISVAEIQVGLLASARQLQTELNELAYRADTATPTGRAMVLQEAALALLRHPEYWVYARAESHLDGVDNAETKFNQLALAERSKFTSETLSNVNSVQNTAKYTASDSLPDSEGAYIVVTVLIGVAGKLKLSRINDTNDLRQALQDMAGIGSDRLLAIEILWSPQATGDTLTSNDIIVNYPDLKLV